MAKYVNAFHVSVDPTRTEFFINFTQNAVKPDNSVESETIAELVMTGDLAIKLRNIIDKVFSDNKNAE